MNYDSNSSTSSDEFYDNMVRDFINDNERDNHIENTINSIVVPFISSSIERDNLSNKHRIFVPRDREEAHNQLMRYYFCSHPLYNETMFRRRFRMHKHVFLRIVNTLSAHDSFFQPLPNGAGVPGASTLQKCTAAFRMLSYGTSADHVDEYLKLAASTAKACLAHFVDGVVNQFSSQYLRKANTSSVQRLLQEGEHRGFPGMMGSIDCMHWEWKIVHLPGKECIKEDQGRQQ